MSCFFIQEIRESGLLIKIFLVPSNYHIIINCKVGYWRVSSPTHYSSAIYQIAMYPFFKYFQWSRLFCFLRQILPLLNNSVIKSFMIYHQKQNPLFLVMHSRTTLNNSVLAVPIFEDNHHISLLLFSVGYIHLRLFSL